LKSGKDVLVLSSLLTSSLENLKHAGFPVDRILQQKNNFQHIVNRMKIDQGDEISFTRDDDEMEVSSPVLGPSDNLNYIFEGNTGTINFETTQVLRSSLQNALKACYSGSIDNNEVKEDYTPKFDDIMGNLSSIIQNSMKNSNEKKMDYCEIIPGI
jgi:hypothetical protein